MLKKFLGLTLATLLCLPVSGAFANSNFSSSSKEITTFTKTLNSSSNVTSNYKELLDNGKIVRQNDSNDLWKSEKIVDSNIQKEKAITTDVNKALLDSLQKVTKQKTKFKMSKRINNLDSLVETTTSSAVNTTTPSAVEVKPVAQLKYLILNPESLKNGQITTDTQIAWLWSYNGQNYTYDPNGYQITQVNIDGTPGVTDSIIGTLTGNIGFATQFKTPGQYILKFKCMNDHNVWSDEWSISIPVEPTDNNTRPQCTINYSALSGNTDTQFVFGWFNSKDNDANDSIKDVQGIVYKDGTMSSLSNYIINQDADGCAVNFNDPGNYTLMFRVSDTHDAWSNWVTLPIVVTDGQKHTIQQVNINSNDDTDGGHNGIFNVAFVNSLLQTEDENFVNRYARISSYGFQPTIEKWLDNMGYGDYDLPDMNYTHTLIKDWMIVNGTITNSDGTPASNVPVKIAYKNPSFKNSSDTLTAYTTTDSNGNYTYKFNSLPETNSLQYETHGIGSSLLWAYTYYLSPGTVTVSCGKNTVENRVMQFDNTTVNGYVLGTSEYVAGMDTSGNTVQYIWEPFKLSL